MPSAAHPLADASDAALARARQLFAAGRNDEAYAAYLQLLSHAPAHRAALHELGGLAHADGYRSAARSLYQRIVQQWPHDGIGRVNLGNILYEDGDRAAARMHFEAALANDGGSADAHRGLGRILCDEGDQAAADRHWRQSFAGQAVTVELCRGTAAATPLLLLVSAKGGNIPTRLLLDNSRFAVTVLYAEYYRPDLPLPPHALLFNAIGDADLCGDALAMAEAIVARSDAPSINPPALVRRTGRAANAARLAALPGVRAPRTRALPRATLAEALTFPTLLRAQGFHTGQHFVRVERRADLAAAAASLPGEILLAIDYLDARGADGLARKYRVMWIGGKLYPLHLAISADWKVHYFTADMEASAAHRAEEKQFLDDMTDVLGAAAMAALAHIAADLGLDYAGIDFALDADGAVLLFEANATMVIHPPAPGPMWDYRRAPIARALEAGRRLVRSRTVQPP